MFGLPIAMNQTCYALRSKHNCNFFVYCHLKQSIGDLVHAGHGSVFNTITTSTFKSSNVLLPDVRVAKAFEQLSRPLFLQILSRQQLSESLVVIRDTLLPKLLSGEIRVTAAEKLVEEIV